MTILNEKQRQQLGNKDWRLSHFYKIKDKNKKLIQFKRNRAQRDFNEKKHSRNIILKSRQLGFTTDESMDMLDDALFTRNFDGLLIAQDLDTAKDIFSNKVDLAWLNFPLKHLYIPDTSSARQIKLGFGDKTFSSITIDSSGRAGTYHRLHITEFDTVCKFFSDKAREMIEGSIPAVPLRGRVDIESTAKQSEGMFYNMFWEAWERGEPRYPTEFKAHFYNWQWDDEELGLIAPIKDLPQEFLDYQKQHNLSDVEITYYYFKWLSLNKDWQSLKQEYPTTVFEAFEGAGNKLFDQIKLGLLQQKTGNREGDWIFYEDYILGNNYVMGADVAEGVGQDSSTAVIWNITPLKPKIAAEFHNNKIAPDLFAYELKNSGSRYGMALVAPERNNHGHTTISKLREIYPEKYIYKDEKDRFGWQTNLVSKPKMMYDLSTAVNQELVDIPSPHIISEMRRYDKEELRTTKFDELKTQHYDLLIATAIGFQMKDEKRESEVYIHKPSWKSYGHKK